MKTSEHLKVGDVYTREDLKAKFQITDATINTGIFLPAGHESVWLFVTEKKTSDRTQYEDLLNDDILDWDGQPTGRKDHLVIEHKERGLELLLFYRKEKYEYPGAGFKFEGLFDYKSHAGAGPAHFKLSRASRSSYTENLQKSAVEAATATAEAAAASKTGQGFSASPERRKAIELHAMSVAIAHFKSLEFDVEDVSSNSPYDLLATKGVEKVYIEVKGTSSGGEQVFLTKNEVTHAQDHAGECVLFIVYGIEIGGSPTSLTATGGSYKILWPWVPAEVDLIALSFQYAVPPDATGK